MNRISTLLIAIAFPVAFAAPLAAQEGKTLGAVIDGNTTIEFKAADTSDIDTQKLKMWSRLRKPASEDREGSRVQAQADQ